MNLNNVNLSNLEFVLFENDTKIYSSYNFNYVVHEMLSILLNYLSFQKVNGFDNIPLKTNLYINVSMTESSKRYPINVSSVYFSLNDFSFEESSGEYEVKLEKYNLSLVEKIKSLIKKPNIKINKLRSLDNNEKDQYYDQDKNITNFTLDNLDNTNNAQISNFIENTKKLLVNNLKMEDSMLIIPKKMNSDKNDNDSKENDLCENDPSENELELNEELEKKIREEIENIENIKKMEEDKIIEIKKKHDEEKENLVDYECEIKEKKMMERIKKDLDNQKKRIFESDKNSYFLMKKDINEGKLKEDNISVLFKQKYPIFKFMDENGDLNLDNEFEIYSELFNGLYEDQLETDDNESCYIPHNYHYLSEEEKLKYKNFVESNKKKNIPSYDDLLMELNEIEKEELIKNSGIDIVEDRSVKKNEDSGEASLNQIKKIFENNLIRN